MFFEAYNKKRIIISSAQSPTGVIVGTVLLLSTRAYNHQKVQTKDNQKLGSTKPEFTHSEITFMAVHKEIISR